MTPRGILVLRMHLQNVSACRILNNDHFNIRCVMNVLSPITLFLFRVAVKAYRFWKMLCLKTSKKF